MKPTIKILTIVGLVAFSTLSTNAYKEIKCNTDTIFSANSCTQCFDGGEKGEGANLGFLKDDWINNSLVNQILYKEEQEDPIIKNLSPSLVVWKQNPSAQNFWEYTEELNKLYNSEEEGYVLNKGKQVTWLQSKKGYAYSLDKNKAPLGENIGLLIYPISVRNFEPSGKISPDATEHKECILFKSGNKVEIPKVTTPVTPDTKPTQLVKTGPENIFIIFLALFLGLGIMKIRKKV